MVGEAGKKRDFGEREFGIEEKPAGGADPQTAGVFTDAFGVEAAKNPGEMDGMDPGFGA